MCAVVSETKTLAAGPFGEEVSTDLVFPTDTQLSSRCVHLIHKQEGQCYNVHDGFAADCATVALLEESDPTEGQPLLPTYITKVLSNAS